MHPWKYQNFKDREIKEYSCYMHLTGLVTKTVKSGWKKKEQQNIFTHSKILSNKIKNINSKVCTSVRLVHSVGHYNI